MRQHASETLASYLANHDLPCHHCGYNLRGCTEPVCPECGTVIARPVGRDRQQALRCLACGYELGLAPLERCPECGSDEIHLGVRETPIRPHPLGFYGLRLPAFRSWKGVPRVLWAAGALSILGAAGFIAQILDTLIAALAAPRRLPEPLLATAGVLAPAIAAALWYSFRSTINAIPTPTRRRLIVVSVLGSAAISVLSFLAWA